MNEFSEEIKSIIEIYNQRKSKDYLYNYTNHEIYLASQERERILIKWLHCTKLGQLSNLKLLEFGCGTGFNFLTFIKLGFNPSNLFGNDLIEDRIMKAKSILPDSVNLYTGDISQLNFSDNYFDIIYQSTVFSSVLNKDFKTKLASDIWKLTKPGGGVLWYDFIYNNPKNKDVKGIKFDEIKSLFPYGIFKKWKLTLAPPLSRRIIKIHPVMYNVFNIFPFLRTHILCWIKKKE